MRKLRHQIPGTVSEATELGLGPDSRAHAEAMRPTCSPDLREAEVSGGGQDARGGHLGIADTGGLAWDARAGRFSVSPGSPSFETGSAREAAWLGLPSSLPPWHSGWRAFPSESSGEALTHSFPSVFAQGADGIRGLKGTKGEKVSAASCGAAGRMWFRVGFPGRGSQGRVPRAGFRQVVQGKALATAEAAVASETEGLVHPVGQAICKRKNVSKRIGCGCPSWQG